MPTRDARRVSDGRLAGGAAHVHAVVCGGRLSGSVQSHSREFPADDGIGSDACTRHRRRRAQAVPRPGGSTATGPLPRASAGSVTRTSTPLLGGKVDAAAPIAVVSAQPAITASPTIAAAPAQLVLRKAVVSTGTSQGPAQPPSITPSTQQVIARTADGDHATPNAGTSTFSNDWNIDWIAEQVGSRLARRLDIERERLGVRPWRQVN